MQLRYLILPTLVAAALSPAGCKKDINAELDLDDKKALCGKVADNMGAFASGLGAALVDGLSEGKADNELDACVKAAGSTEEASKCLHDSDSAHASYDHKAVAECMKWPDAVVRCTADMNLTDERCVEAFRKWEGLAAGGEAKPGASHLWSARFEEEVHSAVVTDAGRAVALQKHALVGLDDKGAVAWRVEMKGEDKEHRGWLLALPGDRVAVGDDGGHVRVFAAKDGKPVHSVKLPGDEESAPLADLAAVSAGDLIVYTTSSTLLRVKTAKCEGEACVETVATGLPSRYDWASDLTIGPDGRYWITWGMGGETTVVARDGKSAFGIRGEFAGPPAFEGKHAYLAVDSDLLVLAPQGCTHSGDAPVAELAPSCLVRKVRLDKELDGYAPVVTGDGVYLTGDGRLFGVAKSSGQVRWKQELDGQLVGPVHLHEGKLWLVESWTMDTPSRVISVDPASGAPHTRSAIPTRERSFLSDPWLVAGDKSWIVGMNKGVAAFPR